MFASFPRRLHQLRKKGIKDSPIRRIAADLINEAWVLCFDEFQVRDIADGEFFFNFTK